MDQEIHRFIDLHIGQQVTVKSVAGSVVGRQIGPGGACKVLVQIQQMDPLTGKRMVMSAGLEDIHVQ